jgi:ubiquinone/menaquinone biosynthesis C-methylase UbiE
MKFFQSISYCYNNLSISGKLLILICLFLFFVIFFKMIDKYKRLKEGYSNNDDAPHITFKEGNDIYDDFYADIYDHLVYNPTKNIYEIKNIIKMTNMNNKSIIVDIGCGTGHHMKALSDANLNAVGIDISPSMIHIAKTEYPSLKFKTGDALNSSLFPNNSLTHILCLYFTIYYFNDKRYFFDNCMEWLMPGGYLIVHLVDRETFDPILPPGNPLYFVSAQKYAKERITHTKVTFTDFVYKSNFNLDTNNNLATFDEKFKFKNGKIRKQQQKLYMEDTAVIVNIAQECGFILKGKIDLVKCAYENQFLYIFVKPS